MATFLPQSLQNLIDEFSRLPGIGPKSAQRLAMHLLHSPKMRVTSLANTIGTFRDNLKFCTTCWNISEDDTCKICANNARNKQQICVVEDILDVLAIEKTMEFKGVYHVLHGALSPVDGIGPDQLKIAELEKRIKTTIEAQTPKEQTPEQSDTLQKLPEPNINIEVILATNPGLEGETTALYIVKMLKPYGVKVTRIARGLPIGGDLDYADELTLTKALQGRSIY